MKKTQDRVNIKALQIRMLVAYAILLFVSVYAISTSIVNVSKGIVTNKVSSLVEANCQQIELNANNYFNTVEVITTLLFGDEKYYKYDPVTNEYDEYARIKSEDEIADRISDLGLMQNFSDFFIVYANGNRVGWTSNTTAALYEKEELYGVLSDAITNPRTNDGWAFGVGGVTDRLYYVKRLNDNAIITTSFYSSELENAFEHPQELEEMVINLVNDDNIILYSSDPSSIGGVLDAEIAGILSGQKSENYIVNAHSCENGWRIICTVPTDYIISEVATLRNNAIIMSLAIAAVMLIIGLIFLYRVFKPVDNAVEELQEEAVTDKLSGLFNKQNFNSEVCKKLSGSPIETVRTFVMIDVDNFKQINDNMGHAYGDEFIVRMGKLVSEQFDDNYILGRVGGDEFAIYTESGAETVAEGIDAIVEKIKDVFEAFDVEFSDDKAKLGVSLSIGIAVLTSERRFDNLYKAADEALYISKKSGKNRYTLYEKEGEK